MEIKDKALDMVGDRKNPTNPSDLETVLRLQKLIAYRRDPVKFFTEQCAIQHPTKGMMPFTVFPAQAKCARAFVDNRFNIILKSRQLGISTVVAAYCLWKCVFFPHQEVRVVATKKESSQIIVRMAWNMLLNVDSWILDFLGAGQASERKHTIELKNGSRMQSFGQAKGDNPDTGVGQALSLLVIDEAALISNIKEVWTTIFPTLSQGGDCIILSTPRGTENWFYKMFDKAEQKKYEVGEQPFNPIRLMWWENLERIRPPHTPLIDDPTVIGGKINSWARAQFSNMTPKEIAQEYCCDFIMSGEAALEPEVIDAIRTRYVREPRERQGENQDFWIWEYPKEDCHYIISADVGKGDGSDYSTAQVICVENFEQVAEFQHKVPMDRFGSLLCKWGHDYNRAMLIPENNNYGQAVVQKIIDSNYPNLFYFDKRFKGLVFPELNERGEGKKEPGWITTSKTREAMLENLLKLLRSSVKHQNSLLDGMDGVIVHSSRVISELRTWGYHGTGGRLDHAKDAHDDLLIALAIGCFVKSVYNRISENHTREVLDFNKLFINDKAKPDMDLGLMLNKGKAQDQYTFEGEDISWLLN